MVFSLICGRDFKSSSQNLNLLISIGVKDRRRFGLDFWSGRVNFNRMKDHLQNLSKHGR